MLGLRPCDFLSCALQSRGEESEQWCFRLALATWIVLCMSQTLARSSQGEWHSQRGRLFKPRIKQTQKNPLPNFTSALSPFLKHYDSGLPGSIFTSLHKDEMANGGTTEGAQRCAFGGFGPGHPQESLGDNRRRYTQMWKKQLGSCVLFKQFCRHSIRFTLFIRKRETNVLCFRLSSIPHLIQSLSANHISGCLWYMDGHANRQEEEYDVYHVFLQLSPTPQNVHLLIPPLRSWKKKEVCPAHKHTDCFYLVMIPKSTQCPNYSHSLSTVLGTADLTGMS